MSSASSSSSNKPLPTRARQIIANVIKFFRHEAESGIAVYIRSFKQRALDATRVSEKLYREIVEKTPHIRNSDASKSDRYHKQTINGENVKFLRESIHNSYITDKKSPTLQNLLDGIQNGKVPFDGGRTTLYSFIKNIGFEWVLNKSKFKLLLESDAIRYQRVEYLKKILEYRQQHRPIVYLDKRPIDYSFLYQLCKDDALMTLSRSKRGYEGYDIMYAVGDSGVISNCSNNLECESFAKWLETQLLPNLPPRSVLIIDNNTYQSINVDDLISTKAQMIEWLQTRHLTYDVAMTKAELYAIIKSYKSENSTCKLDKLLESYGFDVLKLPAYHPELSPISGFWDKIQELFVSQKTNFVLKDIKGVMQEKFEAITQNDCLQLSDPLKIIEKDYLERQIAFDNIIDDLEIIFNDHNSDDDCEEVYQFVDKVMEVEQLSDEEFEENHCSERKKLKIDTTEAIQVKQEGLSDDELEIDDWKPPNITDDGRIKDEIS